MTTTRISFAERNGYKAVVEFLNDGYAEYLVPALWDCIVRYLPSMVREGIEPGEPAMDAHWALCELLRHVLIDEYGLDLLAPEAPRPNAPRPPEGGGSSQPVEKMTIDN